MRINPIFDCSPVKVTRALEPEEFGSEYKEKEYNVWEFKFQSERDEALTPEMLREDFDLIPVIKGLEESIINNSDAFRTTGMAQNIVFMYADNKESLET